MREIKFRAWVAKDNQMVGHNDLMLENSEWFAMTKKGEQASSGWVVSDVELMQYTGLKDKDGVEIYEGDFLTGGVWGDVKPFLMEWKEEEGWSGMADGYPVNRIGFIFDQYYFRLHSCKVIGNIYENPELLETNNE